MFGNLRNHFAALTDVRIVKDPWGLGITVPVLRWGAEEWDKFREKHKPGGGLGEAIQRAQLVKMADRFADDMDAPGKPGMRRRRKSTKGEAARERKESMRSALREALEEVPLDELTSALDENVLKLGLALVGMPEAHAGRSYSWAGVCEDDGTTLIPFTLENRLWFLGWKGVLCRDTETGAVSFERPAAPHRVSLEILEFDGNPRNADGELLVIPEGHPSGYDGPVGDALAAWLLDEAEAADSVQQETMEEAADSLNASPSGASATSAE
jgi:hypothetical protein